MKTARFLLTGVNGMVMHSGQLADPGNSFAKQLKAFTGKRKKVDSDFLAMSEIEFKGSLYLQENGNGLEVVLPADVIEASLINGAKKSKEGMIAKTAIFVNNHSPLLYDGPSDPEQLWEDKRFVFVKAVNVSRAKIMRTRAFFANWQAEIEVEYNSDLANLAHVQRWVKDAGEQVGVGSWRPRHGRFTAELLG